MLFHIFPSWCNCHFKNWEDSKRRTLQQELRRGEKLLEKKQKPGSNFLPSPLSSICKFSLSLQTNKSAGFKTNYLKDLVFTLVQNIFPKAVNDGKIISHPYTRPHTGLAAARLSRQALFGHKVVKLNLSSTQRSYPCSAYNVPAK